MVLRKKKKRKSAGISLMPHFIFISILLFLFTLYLGFRIIKSDMHFVSISIIALFAGIVFESIRILEVPKLIFFKFIIAYLLSMFCFIPFKNEEFYNLDNHLAILPYYFLFFYCLIFMITNEEKLTLKLTEGMSLILSISFIYWVIDYGFLNFDNWFLFLLIITGFCFSFYSFINAFTTITLTRTVRLILSFWCSIILLAFAIDNVLRVFKNDEIENMNNFSSIFYVSIQYFLLGVSSLYTIRNFYLVINFLPSKNGNYKKDLAENKKIHINRFSPEQVLIKDSFICLIYSGTLYVLNFNYNFLPRHTFIWLVIITLPLIHRLYYKINKYF